MGMVLKTNGGGIGRLHQQGHTDNFTLQKVEVLHDLEVKYLEWKRMTNLTLSNTSCSRLWSQHIGTPKRDALVLAETVAIAGDQRYASLQILGVCGERWG